MFRQNNIQNPHGPSEGQTFFGLGIAPKILEILDKIKFKTPTPIQLKAIPLGIEGKDVIGIAQTGTGKTHAFAIPMIQHLAQKDGISIVLAPTRELAIQIDEAVRVLAQPFGMKTACLIGGAPMGPQIDALRRRPQVIIATPGRFIDHMENRNMLLIRVTALVIDEADRMLDMGFMPQVDRILKNIPKERQTMLFSATMPAEIIRIIKTYMKLPTHVEIAPSGTAAENVAQELYIVKREAKVELLKKVLDQYHGTVLLFTRTKHLARKLSRVIRQMGHRAVEMHSDRTLNQRREALEGFKSGRYRILVATDIASRGIDVTKIEVVVNFDLPEDVENYVHRIGRTGRAGCKGRAISFATPDQRGDVKNIERFIRMQIPVVKHPDMPGEEFSRDEYQHSGHRPPEQRYNKPYQKFTPHRRSFGHGFRSGPRRDNFKKG